MVKGQAWELKPYIKAEFAWLTLPALMVLSNLVILLATIYRTRRASLPVWKSSVAAMLRSTHTDGAEAMLESVALMDQEGKESDV